MQGNLYANIPDTPANELNELFETLAQGDAYRLERIVSRGHATPRNDWYDQMEDEWVVLLQGQAGLRFEDQEPLLELGPGDYVWIPAHRRHRVEWTDAGESTVWLALHITTKPPT